MSDSDHSSEEEKERDTLKRKKRKQRKPRSEEEKDSPKRKKKRKPRKPRRDSSEEEEEEEDTPKRKKKRKPRKPRRDSSEEEEDTFKRKKKRKGRTDTTIKFKKTGENPNPSWQKKFGRTSDKSNVYEIPDVGVKECGTSNEWCTPQSNSHCGSCVFCISLTGIVLMIYAFSINMHQWSADWGAADCDGISGKVFDQVSAYQ
eukprot:641124_1